MIVSEPYFIAFVDESSRNSDRTGRFYLMSAAIVDLKSPDYQVLSRTLHRLAADEPEHSLHARDLHRTPEKYENAELAIARCTAVKLIVSVRAPIRVRDSWEDARQRCLAELVARVTEVMPVSVFRIDSRDDLLMSRISRVAKPGSANFHDVRTIRGLEAMGEIPHVEISHGNDQRIPDLWIADIVAYSVSSALSHGDPERLKWFAPRLELREARVLPVDQRKIASQRTASPTVFQLRLDEFKVKACESLLDQHVRGDASLPIDWEAFESFTSCTRVLVNHRLSTSDPLENLTLDDYVNRLDEPDMDRYIE